MKILKFAGLALGMLFSTQSWAYTIDAGATEVGALDTILAETTLAISGEAEELAWVQSILGASATFDAKDETGGGAFTLVDGETDVYAAGLTTNPAYFLLKVGDGGLASGNTHFLYSNFAELSFAVVDLSDMGLVHKNGQSVIDVMRISHVSEFMGQQVSAPGTLAMLGLGLIGFAASRKRG